MTAIGVPMEGRGTRADEYLAAMRSLWHDAAPGVRRQVRRASTASTPTRGRSSNRCRSSWAAARERAFLRAARHADGWYGFMIGLRAMAEYQTALEAAIERTGRTEPLHVSVTPARPLDEEVVGAYAERGVQRLIVMPPPDLDLAGVRRVRRGERTGADRGDARLGARGACRSDGGATALGAQPAVHLAHAVEHDLGGGLRLLARRARRPARSGPARRTGRSPWGTAAASSCAPSRCRRSRSGRPPRPTRARAGRGRARLAELARARAAGLGVHDDDVAAREDRVGGLERLLVAGGRGGPGTRRRACR